MRFIPLFALAACASEPTDSPNQTCADPRYGDGVCQTDLSCDVPDIDCIVTFPDDATAAAWFTEMEQTMATEQNRPPRATLAETDPRYQQARVLADRGWDAFRSVRPVGDLAAARPAVVVVDDPAVNAFVMPYDAMATHAAFSIQVQTGLLAVDAPDEGRLGVMMHELEHAVGLQVIPEVSDRMRAFYPGDLVDEPIGELQTDDPMLHAAWTAWLDVAHEVGAYHDGALGGFPLPNSQLSAVLDTALAIGDSNDPAQCTAAHDQVNQIRTAIASSRHLRDDSLGLPATFASDASAALAEVDTTCLAGYTGGFVDVVAALTGATPDAVSASLSADDHALVDGASAISGLVAIAEARRTTLASLEDQLPEATGVAWTDLRFYSREENADDTSVPVLRAAGLDPDGLGSFLVAALGPEAAACQDAIAAHDVAYGPRLDDDHHSVCFRVEHLAQRAQEPSFHVSRVAVRRDGVRLPRRLSELVVY